MSPARVEFDVPADGSTQVEFTIYDFTGDLKISPRDIPLRVEPTTVPVTAKEEGTKVVLTFYGDKSLGSKIYQGTIRFMAETGGSVAVAIDVRARVTNLVKGETPVLASPEESPPPAATAAAPTPPAPTPAAPAGTSEFPVVPVAGIAAGTAIVITLIVVIARRRRY